MKNENVLPGKLVSPEIRLEVYKEALNKITLDIQVADMVSDAGKPIFDLCILLPVVMWDFKSHLFPSPSGINWWYGQTLLMFPEIFFWIEMMSNFTPAILNDREQMNALRKGVLSKCILDLEKELHG